MSCSFSNKASIALHMNCYVKATKSLRRKALLRMNDNKIRDIEKKFLRRKHNKNKRVQRDRR